MKNIRKFLLVVACTAPLAGCGMVSSSLTSKDTMLEKAEFATGINKNNLTIVEESVSGSLDAVNFTVKDKQNNTYKCYFTSAIAVTSDAVCTKISENGK